MGRGLLALAAAAVTLLAFAGSSGATTGTTITVTSTTDPRSTGTCTLRLAVIAANTDTAAGGCPAGSGADTIVLPAGTYTLDIPPTGSDGAASGDLNLTAPVTIKGAGSGTTIVDAQAAGDQALGDRVFHITGAGAYAISGLTIEHGQVTGAGGGVAIDDGSGASVTLSHDVVTANTATSAPGDSGLGGGAGIYNGATVTLTQTTVSDNTLNASVKSSSFTFGGGVWNDGAATIRNSAITRNTNGATTCGLFGDGGGIYTDGPLTVQGSRISQNTACYLGGGVSVEGLTGSQLDRDTITSNSAAFAGGVSLDTSASSPSASSSLTNSTIDDNSATMSGAFAGGVYVNAAATMSGDTVSGNTLPAGGSGAGIVSDGSVTLTDSTVTENGSATESIQGGGIYNAGQLTMLNDTLAANSTKNPSGGTELYDTSGTSGTVRDTIFYGDDQCEGTNVLTSLGNNLENVPAVPCWTNSDPTSISVADPRLGPLTGHGGPTQTMALLPGSPALDAGADCASTDQRGAPRNPVENGETVGKACDIGAYERAFCRGVLVDRVGTPGNDTINGGPGNDGILALAGNDTINPGAGDDGVCAGAGDDTVSLKDGSADSADGGPGTDTVTNHDANLDTLVRFEVVH